MQRKRWLAWAQLIVTSRLSSPCEEIPTRADGDGIPQRTSHLMTDLGTYLDCFHSKRPLRRLNMSRPSSLQRHERFRLCLIDWGASDLGSSCVMILAGEGCEA